MSLRKSLPPSGEGKPGNAAFEARFRTAARRVLVRRGVAEDQIDAEIERLRRASPSFDLPSVEELERLLTERADRS